LLAAIIAVLGGFLANWEGNQPRFTVIMKKKSTLLGFVH